MKALLRLTALLFLVAACSCELAAQAPPTGDSLDYFPYRAGDSWRVRNADTDVEDYTLTVLRDSVDSIGNRFFLADVWFKVDTSGDVYINPFRSLPELQYRLRAKVGERWKLRPGDTNSTANVTCASIFPMNVFGEVRMVKEFHYWAPAPHLGLDSFWLSTRWVARGIGETSQFYEPDALYYVSGAIIGGRAYGDMISSVGGSSSSALFSLRVTPNPFAVGATISYHLDTREHVRLTLSDALGRVVAVPVDQLQDAGGQTVNVDGHDLLDGTYFYRLTTSSHTASGSLIRRR